MTRGVGAPKLRQLKIMKAFQQQYLSIQVKPLKPRQENCVGQKKNIVYTRAVQCIEKEILISKNGNIDIDIEIDKRMF